MPALRTVATLAAAVLISAALSPVASASATTPQCVPDHCDFLLVYYTDSTYTTWVGQFEDGPCGQIDYGVRTSFVKRFQRTC